MELIGILDAAQEDVLQEASEALRRAHLTHYEALGSEESRQRLGDLFALVLECLTQRNLVPISQYAQHVAEERFSAGFDIAEVLTAFNVLEEALWRQITKLVPPQEYPDAFGLVSTILGAGKQALALQYVALARQSGTPALDVDALFAGSGV